MRCPMNAALPRVYYIFGDPSANAIKTASFRKSLRDAQEKSRKLIVFPLDRIK